MNSQTLESLVADLSIYSRVLDSAGEQHGDRDVSAIAYRLRLWVSQLETLIEETEQPSPIPHDRETE